MLLYIILSDSSSDYKSRLISLHVLLLMMLFELKNIRFFIKSLTSRSDLFNILDHALFASGHTKSTKFAKLGHQASKTDFVRHFISDICLICGMLSHLYLSVHTISTQLNKFFWLYFLTYFDFNNPCTFHFLCPHQICSNKPTVSNSSSLSTLASSYINYNSFHVFYIKLHIYRLLAYTSELFILPYIKKIYFDYYYIRYLLLL